MTELIFITCPKGCHLSVDEKMITLLLAIPARVV